MADMEPTSKQQSLRAVIDRFARTLSLFMAVAIGLAGVVRVAMPSVTPRLDYITLTYFAVAAVLIVLPDVKSLAFGDYKVEFERVEKVAEAAMVAAEDAKTAAIGAGGPKAAEAKVNLEVVPRPGNAPDDPWKGQFGGKSQSGTRKIEASVREVGGFNPYQIQLMVSSTDPKHDPLKGSVQFFLHDTFKNDRPTVSVDGSGTASLTLRAYGSFTVGVLADGGRTRLELDLAELPGVPQDFKDN